MRVLLLGLDNAGKTTILYHLIGKPAQTVPTIGFNVETVKFDPLEFVVWDVSGQDRLRTFWRHYYRGTSGVIFVVDSNDTARLELVKKELHGILKEEELQNAVLIILANKQDLPNALPVEGIAKALALDELKDNHKWTVQATVASKGTGLKEGLTWLAKNMKPL